MSTAHILEMERVRQRSWQPETLPEPLPVSALPTPALVLDRGAFERNVERMAAHVRDHDKGARPHAKTHKCPLIARQQLAAGAVGVCVAKLGEAAALSAAGIDDLLLTSPIVNAHKIGALNTLLEGEHQIKLVVDSVAGAEMLVRHIDEGHRLGVVLDIDVELGRTGAREPAKIQQIIATLEGDARFYIAGVQHYAGHLMHVESFSERQERSLASWQQALDIASQVLGELPSIVTGCGTGTYAIDVQVPAITDLQVGSYIFMDHEYALIESAAGPRFEDFESALTVACTAISAVTPRWVTVDGGYKAFASDTVPPKPLDHGDLALSEGKFAFAGDEHGFLIPPKGMQQPLLGEVLSFMVPHCDPTVNLHDYYWVREADGMVHERWPITARGCAW